MPCRAFNPINRNGVLNGSSLNPVANNRMDGSTFLNPFRLPTFQIGRTHLGAGQKLLAGTGEDDLPVLHDVAAMRRTQGVMGILFDEQDGHAVIAVQLADGLENLLDIERRQAQRRFVE